jgi:nitrous oxidase accessory protein NosD
MAFGLLVQEEQLSLLEGNRVERNTIGVLMVAAEGAQLHANAIEHNGIGVLIDRAPIGFETARSSVTLRGQRFVGNAADLAVAEEGAALTLRGNSFDRAPPFDLDGDGVLELPFVATTAFAAFAARTPDLLLLAYGPGITLWQQLERSVPGWRVAPFADPTPRRASDSPPPLQVSLPSATMAVLLGVSALLSAAPWGMRRSR